ncbi:MAG: putative protein ninG [Prokaryotic dsDNA virus sp.]|nr:MAG: putative protein ninG [Prokaryotic dsDNA virus sp.]|tara:strand:+ start:16791 stop:17198 length:408 start_codon:yes stop_codon:yes gene_type:complete
MKTISKLKKELDKWFSLFIRLNAATEEGLVQCITCGIVKHYKDGMQNGHFQSRRHLNTRYSELNCAPQCVKCNIYSQGEQYLFALKLDAKYGEGTAEELQYEAKQMCKMNRVDYQEEISYYKNAVNKLKKEKGIE